MRLEADSKTYVIAVVTTIDEIRHAQAPPTYDDTRQLPAAPRHFDDTHTPATRDPPAPMTPAAPAKTQSDVIVEQFLAAMNADDEKGMSVACHAMAESEFGQRFASESKDWELARLQQTPGRDHPLFEQVAQHLERLGPDVADYWDGVELEQMAGAIAHEAKRHHMPAIDNIIPVRDGQELLARWTHPTNDVLSTFATVDKAQAVTQPLDRSLQKLTGETQRQEQQEMVWAQERAQQQHAGLSR